MIITILPNSQNFHAVAYNEHKVNEGLAELLEVQNFPTLTPANYNADNFRNYLDGYSKRNARICNAQFHFSVSCKAEEFSHQQLLDIARMYLKEMGYADEGQPLLVYAHHDTPNNHIHVITSRIAPDGHKINHCHEKRRSRKVTQKIMQQYTGQQQEPSLNEVLAQAYAYRFTSKAQFFAILNSQGYEYKEDEGMPILHIYKGGEELANVPIHVIMRHALNANSPEQKRRRQLRAILQKCRNHSANKEELAAAMKKKFGISLVYLGQKDSPFGYILVDHKDKTVFKGGEFLSIKELLQFEDAPTRFAKIERTIDELLADNPKLTTSDINKILYRQFGTRIHKGMIKWNGTTFNLRADVQKLLLINTKTAKGMAAESNIRVDAPRPNHSSDSKFHSISKVSNVLNIATGSTSANRENEINSSMDLDVDDEQHQRMKWRR